MRFGKGGSFIISKRSLKIIIGAAIVVVLAIAAALWFTNHSLDPRDYFYTDFATGITDIRVETGIRTYTVLDTDNPDSITALFGYSPFPPYIPKNFSLTKAELISQDENDGRKFKDVIRLRYEDTEDPKKFFLIIMTDGLGLYAKSDYLTHNEITDDPASINGNFVTFADFDLCIYKFMGADAYFSKFQFADRDWIVHFENLTKRDIRLIITSIITQSGDVK
ncbi:MAG TPA: hypothetical protein PK854_07850 [Oscillospiraceae bacterium]|nr:hypothetical protein [Oscillospiraceae bacterium]HPS35164.1 hypothetical protein [Oscillospiraceae bacterium]